MILGTTLMEGGGAARDRIQRNTLFDLAALRPEVCAVVFAANGSSWAEEARLLGLEVSHEMKENQHGAPFFRSMMAWVEDSAFASAPLVGYVNGDILFGPDLVPTLALVAEKYCARELGSRLLVVGKRRNTNETLDLSKVGTAKDGVVEAVSRARRGSKTFLKEALDFFFMSRGLFDWRGDFPEFVVGRAHYDNAIVIMAQRQGATIIDVSSSVTALHQNEHGDFSGDRRTRTNADRNWNLMIPNPMNLTFADLRAGHVGQAHFKTTADKRKDVEFQRTELPWPPSQSP